MSNKEEKEDRKAAIYKSLGSAMMIAGLTLMAYSVVEPNTKNTSENKQ